MFTNLFISKATFFINYYKLDKIHIIQLTKREVNSKPKNLLQFIKKTYL